MFATGTSIISTKESPCLAGRRERPRVEWLQSVRGSEGQLCPQDADMYDHAARLLLLFNSGFNVIEEKKGGGGDGRAYQSSEKRTPRVPNSKRLLRLSSKQKKQSKPSE